MTMSVSVLYFILICQVIFCIFPNINNSNKNNKELKTLIYKQAQKQHTHWGVETFSPGTSLLTFVHWKVRREFGAIFTKVGNLYLHVTA